MLKDVFFLFNFFFVLPIVRFLFIKEVHGKENVPENGNFIIAANHINTLDHWILGAVLREKFFLFRFLAKEKGFFLVRWFRRLLYSISKTVSFKEQDNREEILNKLEKLLKEGKIVIIYPEGDVNKSKTLKRGKVGVAELSLKSDVPVLPVGFSMDLRRTVKIGKLMYFREEKKIFKNLKDENLKYKFLQEITDKIMKKISILSKKPYPF